jgi:hypothetical protein
MEWMATITGVHVGYPEFQDLGNFSPRRKIFGERKFPHLSVSNFTSCVVRVLHFLIVVLSVVLLNVFMAPFKEK